MNRSTRQARVIVDELVRCGVTDAVLCPGSRNAPLSFALHAADAAGRLRLHVRIDERTAGFLALGLALRSGRPVPVATTSGTAVANLHPAVLEAAHAGVPLLALTADRPAEAIGTGANQTIVQPGIFGGAVRLAVTGLADAEPGLIRSWVDRAVAAATGGARRPAGPGAGEPAVRRAAGAGRARARPTRPGRRPPWTAVRRSTRTAAPAAARPDRPDAGRGRAPCGGTGVRRACRWWPSRPRPAGRTPCAPGRGCWGCPGCGRPRWWSPAGRPCTGRCSGCWPIREVAVYALADPDGLTWPDVAGTVRAVGSLAGAAPRSGLVGAAGGRPTPPLAAALDRALDEPSAPVAGLRLARAVVAALPDGAQLVLGSSNPVRDVSLAAVPRAGLRCWPTAGWPASTAPCPPRSAPRWPTPAPATRCSATSPCCTTRPGWCIGPDEPRPDLTLVVLNDRGGGHLQPAGAGRPGARGRVRAGLRHAAPGRRWPRSARHSACRTSRSTRPTAGVARALAPGPGCAWSRCRPSGTALRTGHARLRAAVHPVGRCQLRS